MTEELEKRLNELLGMKKQLDELASDKKKLDTISIFEEKTRKLNLYFYLWIAVAIGILMSGVWGICANTGKSQMLSLFFAILGSQCIVLMKIWYHTMATKLSILQEMKQFELRITQMLEKSKVE